MVLSLNEIRRRAFAFVHEWEGEKHERAEAQTFWNEFFEIFGISRRRVAQFDKPAVNLEGNTDFIDLFWKGRLVVEHKSKGEDLDKAYSQALSYFQGLKEEELPKFVIVSDFDRFRVYDLDEGTEQEFRLKDLPSKLYLFDFIPENRRVIYGHEDPVNIKAAEKMGALHDVFKKNRYEGHDLEMLLVRIVFCLFAKDTDIFEKDKFTFLIDKKTNVDGTDVGEKLITLFEVLNTPEEKRQSSLDEDLKSFPYIDGDLFKERLSVPSFDSQTRKVLLDCCHFDWSVVSPAIFGSMFQSVMDPIERHNLGGHYTSEKNIMKVINGLFLDELLNEFEAHKNNKNHLKEMMARIGRFKLLDPACGCGNFLIIAYRELRRLQIRIRKQILKLEGTPGKRVLNINVFDEDLNVDSMYGIEILEFPVRIAQVGLWLMDHLVNMELSKEFGLYYKRLPLTKTAKIVIGNALEMDWNDVISKDKLTCILGNPPFVSRQNRNEEQKIDMDYVCKGIKNYNLLDYVSCWYIKASEYITDTDVKVGLVSTNSITQGEQVGILWNFLLSLRQVKINFAHRTFSWSNDAKGKAHVHVVIIGFSMKEENAKFIYEYENPKAEPLKIKAKNINPYLVDQKDIFIVNRSKPLCKVPEMSFGNMPLDGGHLLLSDKEKEELLSKEPSASQFIKPLISAREFLNGEHRWCLWLVDANPTELKTLPNVLKRVQLVKEFRLNSIASSTRDFATIPTLFRDRQQPDKYILIPSTTSETRNYIPMGFFGKNDIANNSCHIIPNGDLFHFGILTSEMHMVWVRAICGRMKSDYRYSKDLVYNNFPWPENLIENRKDLIRKAAKEVLDCRRKHSSCLADLYDPLTMPKDLLDAHKKLDRIVERTYSSKKLKTDLQKAALLFNLYLKYISN